MQIGVFAPSSVVPPVEFSLGIERLRSLGLEIRVLDQVQRQHFTFAGTDQQRLAAFLELASDDSLDIIYAARGGYGATRLLPLLAAQKRRFKRKLLVGYSDVTALHHFVRTRWGWHTLHAPMPGEFHADKVSPEHRQVLIDLLRRRRPERWWAPLEFLGKRPRKSIEAELVGGNLTLWACLCGTPFQPDCRGRIIFFEDIGEAWYRVDRMLHQMAQSGIFDGVAAVVLGDFTDCNDEKQMVRADPVDATRKQPLRPTFDKPAAMREIFGHLVRLGIPVATGLPVGHGPGCAPLPLGATYRLSPRGRLELLEWEWLE